MNYDMTTPCDQCPFLKKMSQGFALRRLWEFAEGPFPCHKTAACEEDDEGFSEFRATTESQHCAGALIFLAKHTGTSRVPVKTLNMKADIR